MSLGVMIEIEKLNESHVERVKQVKLADEQVKFAGTAEEFLSDNSESNHRYVIKSNGDVVGFFKIMLSFSLGLDYSFCPKNSLVLGIFAIGVNHQGKGIGTRAIQALLPYLKINYPESELVYLTVNCKNPTAKRCYHKSNFVDTGELYLGGEAGPQHIMYSKIA